MVCKQDWKAHLKMKVQRSIRGYCHYLSLFEVEKDVVGVLGRLERIRPAFAVEILHIGRQGLLRLGLVLRRIVEGRLIGLHLLLLFSCLGNLNLIDQV